MKPKAQNNKWIRYGQRTYQQGENDLYDKYLVSQILWNNHKITSITNERLWFWKDTFKLVLHSEFKLLDEKNRKNLLQYKMPDLWSNSILLVTEIDGDIHNLKITDTKERDEFYRNAKQIKLMIINKQELLQRFQPNVKNPKNPYIGWDIFINEQLHNLGIIK